MCPGPPVARRRIRRVHPLSGFWSGTRSLAVCALDFRVLPLTRVYAGNMLFPIDSADEAFRAYRRWSAQLDESATACIRLLRLPSLPELPEPPRGKAFVRIDGAINALTSIAAATLAPLGALGPVIDTFADRPTAQLDQIHMDPPLITRRAVTWSTRWAWCRTRRSPNSSAPTSPACGAALAPWTSDRDYLNSREAEAAAGRFYSADVLDRLRRVVAAVDPDCCSGRIIPCTDTALSAAASAAAPRACW